MAIDRQAACEHLKSFAFRRLFLDVLGWDKANERLPVTVDGTTHTLNALAQKRHVIAYRCDTIPDSTTRMTVERLTAKSRLEHLIVFADEQRRRQVWQWVRRAPGEPIASREHSFETSQSGEALIQRLEHIQFLIEEEESLTLSDVTRALKSGFDVERVTKRFYQRFAQERERFESFIDGLPAEIAGWYVSVIINRLMFIYFLQEKGFLDGNGRYLRDRLSRVQKTGRNRYYKQVLCPLFFEGFARRPAERSPEAAAMLGRIPYLNGGLFEEHKIEREHGERIRIPDAAFEHLFDFFEQYQWHLDERPNRNDNEINPDVLGYIFEKYINQKQTGAYYTKEDITGYISQNTILPYLFDATAKRYPSAFRADGPVWALLRDDPERYIYEAVLHGVECELPPHIAVGLNDTTQRGRWNEPAPADVGLPAEIWREVVERRRRLQEIHAKLAAGEVTSINDVVTLNLDIRQFAQDVIQFCQDPDLLRAFHRELQEVSILDPTCGSGAFLFAALNVLKPLYEACLLRMAQFREEVTGTAKYKDFAEVLERASRHNQEYFILKSIVVNNLFGVDIMDEAVEICKLRLFLKLVANVNDHDRIEPLPDIDFNIRSGNTLVGYATRDELDRALDSRLDFEDARERLQDRLLRLDAAVRTFREMQTLPNGSITAEDKQALRQRFAELETELNDYLAAEYGKKKKEIVEWQKGHKPFHWFAEFHEIMESGGFDVVIGNPPWKEYVSVKHQYQVIWFSTVECGNLHGICTERAIQLAGEGGRVSFIVQLPLTSSSRMSTVRSVLLKNSTFLTVIPFDDRPGKLFEGLQNCRSVIFTAKKVSSNTGCALATTRYQRWPTDCRPQLFPLIGFAQIPLAVVFPGLLPKYPNVRAAELFSKLKAATSGIGLVASKQASKHFIFYQEATRYWPKVTVGVPYYAKNGTVAAPAHGRYLFFAAPKIAHTACAILNSSLFYLYFVAYGDCFHLSDTLARSFPIPGQLLQDQRLADLNSALMHDLRKNAIRKTIQTKDGDTITYAEFSAGQSKSIVDEIDAVLADHYGFTPEELDLIINYDIKYRMGIDQED